jgi:putative salt-induced outer membrane protein YdiY
MPIQKRDLIKCRRVTGGVVAKVLFFALSVCIWVPTALARQATQPPIVIVTTTNDDRLSGRLIEVTAERIGIETSYAGRVNIQPIELKEWATEDTAACHRLTSLFAPKMKAGSCRKVLPLPPVASTAKEPDEWQRTIDFAYAAARGNVNTTDLNAALNLSHTNPDRRIAFSIFGRHSVNNNGPETNLLISTLRFEKAIWEQPGFTETTVEIDRVKEIGYRISNNVGLTYPLLRATNSQLSFDLGTGLTREIFRNGLGRTAASSLLRISGAQKLDDRAQLSQRITILPDLLAPDAFRLQTDVELTMPVTKHLALRLAGLNRFESQPQGAAKRNDFSLLTGLKLRF